jgi:hypothetical protein
VFLVAHVSADARDGTNNFRLVMALQVDTPNRIQKDNGFATNLGKGHPDENNNTNPCIFRRAHGDNGLDLFVVRPLAVFCRKEPKRL